MVPAERAGVYRTVRLENTGEQSNGVVIRDGIEDVFEVGSCFADCIDQNFLARTVIQQNIPLVCAKNWGDYISASSSNCDYGMYVRQNCKLDGECTNSRRGTIYNQRYIFLRWVPRLRQE